MTGNTPRGCNILDSIVDAKNIDCLAKDAAINVGIHVDNSPGSVRLSDSVSIAEGGNDSTGILVTRKGSRYFTNVTASASGATGTNRGI